MSAITEHIAAEAGVSVATARGFLNGVAATLAAQSPTVVDAATVSAAVTAWEARSTHLRDMVLTRVGVGSLGHLDYVAEGLTAMVVGDVYDTFRAEAGAS